MAKIKIYVYTDEVYPVYFAVKDKEFGTTAIVVDEALYQKYTKVKKAWDEVQAELKAIY